MARPSPLGTVVRGLVAGLAGTAAMTAYQELVSRARGSGGGDGAPTWEDAPAPAQVARRVLEGVFKRDVPAERIPLLTNVTHWSYGTLWGAAYGLLGGTVRLPAVPAGLAFGAGVWAMSYVQLVPMGLYKPPWEYAAKTLATDLSYHLVYGTTVAATYDAVA